MTRSWRRFGPFVLLAALLVAPAGVAGARNRLAGESSPYLLLHQDNPVDWYPWGAEALARAKTEDKPIFLSVGYSSCYWCHVMERESFSDPKLAEILNRHFVCIKVDREERPELDEVYMTATQLLVRQGGWPNSVFLTPKLEPFFAGTYFPPEDRGGRQGFATVLRSLAGAFKEQRPAIEKQAGQIAAAMRQVLEKSDTPAAAPPPAEIAVRVLGDLEHRFDAAWGGFGAAPKFPNPGNLLLLLELAPEHPRAAEMLRTTLEKMARGGLYDQLGGGFHRYSTDAEWRVPHFEKMLYDNALLLEVYARFAAHTRDERAARIARETAGFVERELSDPAGGFWSAIDAETSGLEGTFYVWSRAELDTVLGPAHAAALAPILGLDGVPNFEGGRFVLTLPKADEAQLTQVEPQRRELLAARARRVRPATDDKVLTDWNGLAIAGLATAGRGLGEPALVERAARAARFVLAELRPAGGPLQHVWRGGKARIPAFLADYAYLVHGLLALHTASSDDAWLEAAVTLEAEQSARLGAPNGGFFDAAEQPDVAFRLQEVYDAALPAANAVAVLNLLELATKTNEPRYRERAATALRAFATRLERSPEGAPTLALAARRFHSPPPPSQKIDQKAP